jgi:hypothetical protein
LAVYQISTTLTKGVFLRYWSFLGGQNSAINLLIPKQFRGEKEIASSITQSLKVYLRDDLLFFGEQDICGRQIRDQ